MHNYRKRWMAVRLRRAMLALDAPLLIDAYSQAMSAAQNALSCKKH
jgi:hypothetical protein